MKKRKKQQKGKQRENAAVKWVGMTVAVEKTAALNMFFTLVWEFLSLVLSK